MSPLLPDQLLTHTLIHKGVKGWNTGTSAGKSHQACRLICANNRVGSQVLNAQKGNKWRLSIEAPPAQCKEEKEFGIDGWLPAGQRICCIFCKWCERCCQSRWHWWDTPVKTRNTLSAGVINTMQKMKHMRGNWQRCFEGYHGKSWKHKFNISFWERICSPNTQSDSTGTIHDTCISIDRRV